MEKYLLSVLAFSLFGLIFLIILQIAQYYLPLNPDKLGNVKWDLAFNIAASFVTNTNWQAYSGESTLLEPQLQQEVYIVKRRLNPVPEYYQLVIYYLFFLLIFVVLLIGALRFFPALSLGPLAEFFSV